MRMQLRAFRPDDTPRVVEIDNFHRDHPGTVEDFERFEAIRPPELPLRRLVAEVDGRIVGGAQVGQMVWLPPGVMLAHVLVDPAFERRGVGAALYEALQPFVAEHAPRELRCWVRDCRPDALAWAERRGFERRHHVFNSVLKLADFDATRFAGHVERAEAAGFRFVPLTAMQTGANERRLWELNGELLRDVPDAADRHLVPFDEWRKWVVDGPMAWPEACLIAVDGRGEWAGLTSLMRTPSDPARAHIDLTGVRRAYRGRGLALALKLAAMDLARQHGITEIGTNNHSANAPMLAVNRKLGYVPLPGSYLLRRVLVDAATG